jgi:molybdate transport system permease protein
MTDSELIALWLSLKVAGIGALVVLPFGIALGILMARVDFYGKFLVNNLIHLPMVMPPVAVGYILLVLLARDGFLGSFFYDNFSIELAFTWRAAAIAAAVMGFPFIVRAVRLSVEAIDRDTESSAQILGAGKVYRLFYITLPLASPGIIAGFIMGFGRALGEFGATIVVAANIPFATRTLPLALYDALQYPDGEIIALRFAAISIALAAATIALSESVLRFLQKNQKN